MSKCWSITGYSVRAFVVPRSEHDFDQYNVQCTRLYDALLAFVPYVLGVLDFDK